MYPVLANIFGEPVPTYLVFLMLAYAVAIGICVHWAKRNQIDHNIIIDLGLLSVITGILGARLLHVLADGYLMDYVHLCTDPARVLWKVSQAQCTSYQGRWDALAEGCRPVARDCFAWAAFWRGGLTLYGGIFVAFFSCILLARKERIPILKTADIVGVAIITGIGVGRIGCFFSGCCFGKPTDGFLGAHFPAGSAASDSQFRAHLIHSPFSQPLPVHPTQLYEALGCFLLAFVIYTYVLPKKRFDGQVLIISGIAYAALRFFLEFLRADERGGFAGLSTSQWIGIAITIGMTYLFWERAKKARMRASTTH